MKKLGLLVFILTALISAKAQDNPLEIRQYDAKSCLQMVALIKDGICSETEFLKRVRNDASRERCLKDLERIDFEKSILVGVDINSGYCGIPIGLKYQATKDVDSKQFVVNISYLKPNGVCRALSSYDLWLVLPKIPGDYGVRYEIEPTER